MSSCKREKGLEINREMARDPAVGIHLVPHGLLTNAHRLADKRDRAVVPVT